MISRIAFGVLIITGPLMVWLGYGGVAGLNAWFWVKMALVVVMAISIGANDALRRRGNAAAAGVAANISRAALVCIVIAAVLAFN